MPLPRYALMLAGTLPLLPTSAHSSDTLSPALGAGPLGRDIARVSQVWSASSRVHPLPPRFLQRGETIPLPLPFPASDQGCTTVLVLGPRNLAFVLAFDVGSAAATESAPAPGQQATPHSGPPPVGVFPAFPIQSTAGVAQLTRCGLQQSQLDSLVLTLRSPRGAVQFLVARGTEPPPAASDVLVSRQPGNLAPLEHLEARPGLGPLETRLSARARAHRTRGADSVQRTNFPAQEQSLTSRILRLGPGCHRLDVLAAERDGSTPDVDARLVDPVTEETVAEDHLTTSDPALAICQTEEAIVRLEIRASPPGIEFTLLEASWGLPRGLPLTWGKLARAAMARALFDPEAGLSSVSAEPQVATLGVAGSASSFVSTQPGACYRAAVATFRGQVSHLALSAEAGALRRRAQAEQSPGTQLSFCTPGAENARIEVQAAGEDVIWLLAVWQLPRPRVGATL